MNVSRSNILVLALIAWCLAAGSVAATTLSGTVTDQDTQEPIRFVSIVVTGETAAGDSVRTGTITTAAGGFRFTDLKPGRYEVLFSYIGYDQIREAVVLENDTSTRSIDMALVSNPIELENIEVIGDRFADEKLFQTGFISIKAEKLATLPSIGVPDPIRSLQLLPGVQAASDVSSGLYVRGGGPDQTLILLDQVTLYNPTHAFGLFSTFNPDAIDEVSLFKGAYPAEYGGRLGAVLDVRNKAGDHNEFKGVGSVSLIDGSLTLEGPIEDASYTVSARRTYLDPLLAAIDTPESPVPAYYFYDLNGKIDLLSTANPNRLAITGYLGRDRLRFDLDETGFFKQQWGNSAVRATFAHPFSDGTIGTLGMSASDYESKTILEFFDTPAEFSNQLRDVTATADIAHRASDTHRLTAGASVSWYDFTYLNSFNNEVGIDLTVRPTGIAGFVQDDWRPTDRTAIRSGLRVNRFNRGNRTFIEPRLSITQGVSENVRVKAGAGIYNQILQLVATEGFSGADFYVPIDETVDAGRSLQGVAGVEWDISPEYSVSAEAYYTDLSNLLIPDNRVAVDDNSTDTASLFITDGDGYSTGLELFAERRMGALTGWVGYTLGWTRRTFDELNQGNAFPPKYDRRHDLSVVSSYRRGKWTYGSSLVFASGQAFTAAAASYSIRNPATGLPPESAQLLPASRNSSRLLPYHRLDLSMRRSISLFGQPAEWFVNVFNVYSRRNEWFIQYNNAGNSSCTENGVSVPCEPEVVKQLPIIPSFGLRVEF